MAINPVPAHYPGFVFDGENSRNYGVYITGVDIYGAPERDTELVTIPGRNGDYNLDRGRWKNIKITYECAMGADTEADFLTGIDAFRNMLASRIGYKRLEDEINTGEYRQAVFADGFDVDYIDPKAAAFSVVFECKPQRFLTAGETAQAVTSGGTVTNPTLYPASPQLQVWGYGSFTINGQQLAIISEAIGDVQLTEQKTATGNVTIDVSFDGSALNVGDTITSHDVFSNNAKLAWFSESLRADAGYYLVDGQGNHMTGMTFARTMFFSLYPLTYGSPETYTMDEAAKEIQVYNISTGTTSTQTYRSYRQLVYDGSGNITLAHSVTPNTGSIGFTTQGETALYALYGVSTKSALGSPLYFDLDIGEAWKEEGGGIVSVNNAVTIPAKLPTLSPGANTITYDNTITQFKIVPRWWKL